MSQSIEESYNKCLAIVGKKYKLPVTKNKGGPGQFLEDLLGIAHSSNCLDCVDGEIKSFPVKKLKNGSLVPKETIAVTMISTDELIKNDFLSSKCCKKTSRMLVVPYYRQDDTITFMKPKIIDRSLTEFADVYNTIEADYNEIRKNYIETNKFASKIGKILQSRTKGAGHGSVSRAFYLRPSFMKQTIHLSL